MKSAKLGKKWTKKKSKKSRLSKDHHNLDHFSPLFINHNEMFFMTLFTVSRYVCFFNGFFAKLS